MGTVDAHRRALVYVSTQELHKLSSGLILPYGVELVEGRVPQYDPMTDSWLFLVEGQALPITEQGMALPALQTDPSYPAIVVRPPS